MNERLMKLLAGLAFFAADGMAEPGIVKLAKEADELLTDLAQQRGREAAQQQAQPVAWEYREFHGDNTVTPGWGKWQRVESEKWAGRPVESVLADIREFIAQGYKYELRALYTEPPHPRAQLMRVAEAVRDAVDAAYDPRDDREMVDLAAIVDAIQPVATTAEFIDAMVGNDGGRKPHPAPVNQQMLAARAVLIKALGDMMYRCATEWSNSDPDTMVEFGRPDIERIADQYAAAAESAQAQQPTKDEIQAVFEEWLQRVRPSGDVEEVQRQFEESSDYLDLFDRAQTVQAQQPADGVLVKALEKLARLGAGERYGNSDGNVIAQQALAAYFAGRDKQESAK